LTAKADRAVFSPEERERLRAPEALVDGMGKLAKLLADETRLRVLYYLTQRDELHVRALCELLGESQPAVSHHLALLREAGVIERRRQGKHNFYYLQYHRLSGLLDLLFAAMPEGNRRLRFEDYILCHSPAPGEDIPGEARDAGS
jgi:ArsR family transcriptional regulator